MSNGETKYFAVSANNIMWMLIIIALFSMSVFVFTLHKIDKAKQDFTNRIIDFDHELSNIKIKFERLEERVDWNEDQNVELYKWKEKVYQKAILKGGNNAERKASGK